MLTTILSDIGNVVAWYDDPKAVRRLSSLLGEAPGDVRAAVHDGDPSLFRMLMRGDFGREEFRERVLERLGTARKARPEDFERAFGDVFTLNHDVAGGWKVLRRDYGVTVTAVSNMDPIRWERLRRLGVPELFDNILLSYEEKLLKPSEELMLRALDLSGAKAEETLFVDDQAKNFPPADGLGIATHLYSSPMRLWMDIGRLGVRQPL